MNIKDNKTQKLLEKIYLENSEQIADEIEKIELFFAAHPAPKPENAVIENIKGRIESRLTPRRFGRVNSFSVKTAVAALITIIAFSGIRTFVRRGVYPISSVPQKLSYFWGDDAVAAEDPRLSIMADELDDIENSITSIELDGSETESEIAVDDIELEIIELSSGFWRG